MLQYLVALAAVRAVRRLPGGATAAERLRIKWPNDLYAAGESEQQPPAKLGGILCQSSYWQGQFVVTVGVGLNVTNAEPSARLQQLFGDRPEGATREGLLAAFFSVFEEMLDVFDRDGFAPFVADYERSWMHGGQRLQLEDGTRVTVEGLAPQGLLRARDERGATYELHPDGNSLDWFKGLVKKKVAL
jgi:biotin--protein ligase